MSGTVAGCCFTLILLYKIINGDLKSYNQTAPYTADWLNKLKIAVKAALKKLNQDYTIFGFDYF
jgi:hypothetical protein